MIVDLFAGPGGWDVGLRELGHEALGIEIDSAARATRKAAGLRTLRADVAECDPEDFAPCEGLIASPPCTAFSMAGSKGGQRDVGLIYECAQTVYDSRGDHRAEYRARCEDASALLVVEPLRWALALRPTWVACEQVPPVLELWQLFAGILRAEGYSAWAGVLRAEQYGVPQTRKRAFLMAHRERTVQPPVPTHQAYEPGVPAQEQHTLEGVLLPWVSMADALGWGATARPYPVIACSSPTGGPDMEKVGGSQAREALYREQREGRWQQGEHQQPHPRRMLNPGLTEAQPNRRLYSDDEPAPTVAFGHDAANWQWVGINTGRDWKPGGTREDAQVVAATEPEPALDGQVGGKWQKVREQEPRDPNWPEKRPSTTVAGDPRIAQPGHKNNEANPDSPGRMEGAIRVSIDEAAVLQGFPVGYPWQGNKSEQFRQVGNAVPPPLAKAVLGVLV